MTLRPGETEFRSLGGASVRWNDDGSLELEGSTITANGVPIGGAGGVGMTAGAYKGPTVATVANNTEAPLSMAGGITLVDPEGWFQVDPYVSTYRGETLPTLSTVLLPHGLYLMNTLGHWAANAVGFRGVYPAQADNRLADPGYSPIYGDPNYLYQATSPYWIPATALATGFVQTVSYWNVQGDDEVVTFVAFQNSGGPLIVDAVQLQVTKII